MNPRKEIINNKRTIIYLIAINILMILILISMVIRFGDFQKTWWRFTLEDWLFLHQTKCQELNDEEVNFLKKVIYQGNKTPFIKELEND